MPILGAHVSIAGGFHLAVERARRSGCQCLQIFSKNNAQWQAPAIRAPHARQFREALASSGFTHPLAHASYLINLASPDAVLWRRSVNAFVVELRRAASLGIRYVVIHPGAYIDGTEKGGIARVVRALDSVDRRTRGLDVGILLETTAGQGTSLGWRFEHLAAILDAVATPERIAFCFDTCHVFAAGYPMRTAREYRATLRDFDRLVGLERIRAFHLNDSRRPCGSRVDRHEHIGRGAMGLDPFRHLLRDRRFQALPMYLETPKGTENGEDLDRINLAVLRGLVGD